MFNTFSQSDWTVGSLTRYLRELIETDPALRGISVRGEISNLSRPRSGHIYFTLKDADAALKCVIWRSQAQRLSFRLEDGLLVTAYGSLGVYETGGQYQLYVDSLRPAGLGGLYEAFVQLQERLEAEGLFAPERKRPLPSLPRRIGVVTSPTGAALQDILDTIRRRYPLAKVTLSPSQVQGEAAPESLVRALARLMTRDDVDVILIARGGGSLEDLWAFNDERVVRTVAASPVPVISGVGHETDFTLTDFAADVRAPTPTAAAELATPVTMEVLRFETARLEAQMQAALQEQILARRQDLDVWAQALERFSPARRLQTAWQSLDALSLRLDKASWQAWRQNLLRLEALSARLETLNPRAVLQRGYAILTRAEDGAPVSRRAEIFGGLRLRAFVADGDFLLVVEDEDESQTA